jgi:hypothetical protein
MTLSNDTPQRTTLVAVDIAKNYHDVLIQPPPPGRRRRVRIANSRPDFEHLAGYLRGLKSSVLIGFEAASEIPSRRHRSGAFAPASCSRKIPMICS